MEWLGVFDKFFEKKFIKHTQPFHLQRKRRPPKQKGGYSMVFLLENTPEYPPFLFGWRIHRSSFIIHHSIQLVHVPDQDGVPVKMDEV